MLSSIHVKGSVKMNLSKILKWSASTIRLAVLKAGLGSRVSWPHRGKPVYIGRGARIRVAEGGSLEVGAGLYLSENCLVQVNHDAQTTLGEDVFMNANARIIAAESVRIGDRTMLGPNACVYDHDHAFGESGVSGDLMTSPVEIGKLLDRCELPRDARHEDCQPCLRRGQSSPTPSRKRAFTPAFPQGLSDAPARQTEA